MPEKPFRLDVLYPLIHISQQTDQAIEDLIGLKAGSSGGGVSGMRDLQFYFDTAAERDAAAEAVSDANDPDLRVVRREDLDPVAR